MKLLIDLYNISSPSYKEDMMVDFIESKLEALGAFTYRDDMNNLYAIKGESETYPCIVAHTDEVHSKKPRFFEVCVIHDMIFGIDTANSRFAGIGADDKNGIWVALKCFEKFDVIKGAFFVAEEVGCIGSQNADMSFFDDCRFVLQCDRKNGDDFIVNASGVELCSKAFLDDVDLESFNYEEDRGMMTDVMQLKENGLEVSCVNISCGYYNPHTDEEYTNILELENCLALVEDIIERMTDVYPHEYFPTCTGKYSKYDWYNYDNYDYKSKWNNKAKNKGQISDETPLKNDYTYYSDYEGDDTGWNQIRYDDIRNFAADFILNTQLENDDDIIDGIMDEVYIKFPSASMHEVDMAISEVTGMPCRWYDRY